MGRRVCWKIAENIVTLSGACHVEAIGMYVCGYVLLGDMKLMHACVTEQMLNE